MPILRFIKQRKNEIFFVLFFILFFVLATKLMPRLALIGSKRAGLTVRGDILLGAVLSLSLLKGRRYASYFAVVVGFLLDVFVGNPYAFSAPVYFLCAWFAKYAAAPFARKTPLSVLLIAAMLLPIRSLVSFFYLIAVNADTSVGVLLLHGILPEYVVNVLLCVVVFAVMRIAAALFRVTVRE